jgi:NAD(P)-dependent dehydrogenase (short-subunit alcohol dehydrogenase family)
MSDLSAKTTIVVGASRGLGRGIATALAEAGAPVVAVSRTATELTVLMRADNEDQIAHHAWSSYQHQFAGNATRAEHNASRTGHLLGAIRATNRG